jgi:hypothetical protein
MKPRTIARALEVARKSFDQEVARVAELARDQLVPYFQKRGWSYKAGNDTWLIEDQRGRSIEDDQLPAAVRDMLYLEIAYRQHRQYLAYFIRDITHEKTP